MLTGRRLLLLLAPLALLLSSAQSNPDVPLPVPDAEFDPENSFPLLPPVDGLPPPEVPREPDDTLLPEESVIMPPPAAMPDDLPEIEALSLPSDGEPMPDLPFAPGLVAPQFRTAKNAPPLLPGAAPGDGLLPAPDFELKADTSRGYWFPSPREARRVSLKEKKPLLLFFAQRFDARDEQGHTGCPTIALNDDLLVLPEFNKLAGEKLVLSSLQYPPMSLERSKIPEAKKKALKQFQDYFKVTGFPALILIDENGRELERMKGYRRYYDSEKRLYSSAPTLFERLKEAVWRDDQRKKARADHVERLARQGYRTWTNRNGYSILAKLVDVSPERVVLMDEKNAYRSIQPGFLTLYDAEWARRKKAGLIKEPPPGERRTAATAP